MTKITLWYKYNPKTENFEYNHYEYGWNNGRYPNVSSRLESMREFRWSRELAYMDGSTIKHLNEIE